MLLFVDKGLWAVEWMRPVSDGRRLCSPISYPWRREVLENGLKGRVATVNRANPLVRHPHGTVVDDRALTGGRCFG
jgi:hypothetical protein